VVPELRGCGRQGRVADSADGRRPLGGERAVRCLASGCPIAAMMKAARDARKAEAGCVN
jgi:hypothetical protein